MSVRLRGDFHETNRSHPQQYWWKDLKKVQSFHAGLLLKGACFSQEADFSHTFPEEIEWFPVR